MQSRFIYVLKQISRLTFNKKSKFLSLLSDKVLSNEHLDFLLKIIREICFKTKIKRNCMPPKVIEVLESTFLSTKIPTTKKINVGEFFKILLFQLFLNN